MRALCGDLHLDGILERGALQLCDLVRHGCAEKHRLALLGNDFENSFEFLFKVHAQQSISLVQHLQSC
jgi:hypothetical protein